MKALRIKAARILKGMIQHDLADHVRCSEALISKIETGRVTPSHDLKESIARVLEIETWEVAK